MLETWESTTAEIIFSGAENAPQRKQTLANLIEHPQSDKLVQLGNHLESLAPDSEQFDSVITATRKRITP